MLRTLLLVAMLLACATGPAQLSDQERQGIKDALFVGNMRETDLLFARRPLAPEFSMPFVNSAIDSPLETADLLMKLHAGSITASPSQLLATVLEQIYQEPLGAVQHDTPIGGLDELPPSLRGPILGLANWINSTNSEIRRATEKLTPEERRQLIESLPVWAVEEPSVRFSFVRGQTLGQLGIVSLLQKVDIARIRTAAVRLSEAAERAIDQIKASSEDLSAPVRVRIGGMPVVVCGRGNDTHTETDALLTVDLGGDDTYKGRHGAGVGYASVLIDLAGDDTYAVGDLNIGAAVLGVGLAYDLGGHDRFRGKSIVFGAGLAGVGMLSKTGGDDDYRAETLCEGFGLFGIGELMDSGGRDSYDALLFAQGSSRTQGVGWLVDSEGNDEYRAGGLVLNSPLFATAHYSFAQGFSEGFREDSGGLAGGVGLLTDHRGDDFYFGETYQQAASYWYALGTLFDAGGNDTYSGYHYCQSSAMHACASYLFDLGGDDGYIVKVGASHAIGHDYGLAFLLDRGGDDTYASRDSTPGIGNANGLGLFVDSDGIDRYFGPPGKGNPARGSGSLGVFVDLNGADVYKYGLADGQATASDTWGVALDRPTFSPVSATNNLRPNVTPGSEPMPSEAEITGIYRRATQWEVGTATDSVADNLDRLVKIGAPALQWMLDNRLATADRLQVRAFVHVVQALKEEGARQIGAKAFRANDAEMALLLRIATDANVTDFGALVPGLIKKPSLQREAVVAAGVLKATAAVPDLMALCRSGDKLLARAAMVSLAQIGDPSSLATAQAMAFNEDLMARKAALDLMARFPQQAASFADVQLRSTDEFRTRVGIELLGRLGTPEALDKIGAMLLDPRPGVRVECLLRLNGRCPVQFRADFLGLSRDPIESVRAVATTVVPGG